MSHIWWTPNVPYMFYLSAIAAGLAMVTIEGIVSTRGYWSSLVWSSTGST
jgi:hypothetical protein